MLTRRKSRRRRPLLSCRGENRRGVPRRRARRWRSSCMRGIQIDSGFLNAFYLHERHVMRDVLILPSTERLMYIRLQRF
jgi:hypothetical protein